MPRDPYEVLGVGRSSSESDVMKAFRRLSCELYSDVITSSVVKSRCKVWCEA